MTVQIHELVLRATVAEASSARNPAPSEKDLELLREGVVQECMRQVRKILESARHQR